jgi:hypothetical protein
MMPERPNIDPNNIQHVYPINDTHEHDTYCNFPVIGIPYCPCICKPEHKELDNGGMIVVHNSFDGREGVEWTNEILKK